MTDDEQGAQSLIEALSHVLLSWKGLSLYFLLGGICSLVVK